jgi:hypothetical protein
MDPAMHEFVDDVFVEESSVRFYGFRLQTRMAVIRLSGSQLFLYSPVRLSSGLRVEIEQLGRVAFIVSPNKIHNQTLAEYRVEYPDAKLFVPPGLPERRPDLSFDSVLSGQPVEDWSDDLEYVLTKGNAFFSEALFFHRATRTLFVGDFVERIGPGVASAFARALTRLFGVRSHPMASPEFRFYSYGAEALQESISQVLRWPLERIFLCHGELVRAGGREVFCQVAASLLREIEGRGPLSRSFFERIAKVQ